LNLGLGNGFSIPDPSHCGHTITFVCVFTLPVPSQAVQNVFFITFFVQYNNLK
jgi:hypothetical protein